MANFNIRIGKITVPVNKNMYGLQTAKACMIILKIPLLKDAKINVWSLISKHYGNIFGLMQMEFQKMIGQKICTISHVGIRVQ